jgi:hypothetical protein
MSELEIELNNSIDEFILELQRAKDCGSYRSKVDLVAKTATQAQDWTRFWDEKLTKWL